MNMITNHLPTEELQALDAAHHMHPFTEGEALAEKGPRVITRANGVWITDSDGQEILDGMAGLHRGDEVQRPEPVEVVGVDDLGVLDAVATVTSLLALQASLLSLAGVLIALYPAATVLLAIVVLRERVTSWQAVGMVLALSAVALITAG